MDSTGRVNDLIEITERLARLLKKENEDFKTLTLKVRYTRIEGKYTK